MIASTKFCAALLAAILLLVASPPAQADVILKDHVTDSTLWNGVGGFTHFDLTGSNNADTIGAACFTGNGGTLTSFSGIYYKGAMGTPNGGNWSLMDFRFVFYTSLTDFQNNPFGGTFQHVFLQPSNANWLTPVGQWGQYDLFRFDFDLTGLGIQTTNGALHLATVQPLGPGGIDGVTGMSFSTGGGGSIGADLDWYRSNVLNWGPATFQSLNAPHDFMAARITATGTTLPHPGDLNCDRVVNNFDIDPFVLALTAAAEYNQAFPDCDIMNADLNGDGAVNNFDIDPFVECLVQGACD